jgi:SAM-dependent methyltransferase
MVPTIRDRSGLVHVMRAITAATVIARCATLLSAVSAWQPATTAGTVLSLDEDRFTAAAPSAAQAPQPPKPEARDDWNRVYGAPTFAPMTDANAWLAEVVRGRTPGRALDIGMGQGRNSLHLARLGWDVTGVDISDEAVRFAAEEAKKANLSIRALRQDFAAFDLGREQWDLIAGIYMGDLITSNAARIVDALKPGGILIVENFQRDINRPGAVGGAPLGYAANELLTTFAALRVRRYEDTRAPADWARRGDPVPVVRFVGEKR